MAFYRSITCMIAITACSAFSRSAEALPPELVGYDPAGLVRFSTPAEADARRAELIKYIWPGGLPGTTPATQNIDASVFRRNLRGISAELVASVDKLDADVGGYDFHALSYLIKPATPAPRPRLAIVHQGHQGRLSDGVGNTINQLLEEGFQVVAMQMPMTGWNVDHSIQIDATTTVNLPGGHSGTSAHNDLFNRFADTTLPDGAQFRFFLEPIVQTINYFLAENPDSQDITMIGLSGGGWTTQLAAAIDTRIDLSIPVAGSYPLYVRDFEPSSRGDAEQEHVPLFREIDGPDADTVRDSADGVASWLEIYALGGYGPGRRQIQVHNFNDSCCFKGDYFETYDDFVSQVVDDLGEGDWDFVSDTTHRRHQISSFTINEVILPAINIPEPATAALLVLGLLYGLLARRQGKRQLLQDQ